MVCVSLDKSVIYLVILMVCVSLDKSMICLVILMFVSV